MSYTRRKFIAKSLRTMGLSLLSAQVIFEGCESKKPVPSEEKTKSSADPCNDFTDVSEADKKARTGLGYVEKSPDANMKCRNCNLYLPTGELKCGRCLLFKGPVNAAGYCTNWAAKVAAG